MKYKIIIIGCLVFTNFAISPRIVMAQDDWQYWSEYNVNYKISDQLSLIINPSIRIKDDISEYQYWESRQGFSYKFNDQLSTNLHYLHLESKNIRNKWMDENVIEFQPTYRWVWQGFDFANRFRLEYRIANGIEKWRYRHQIKVGRKISVLNQQIIPFISEEIFYDEAVDQMNQNRLRVGVSKKMSKIVTLTVFYQYKSNAIKQDWYGENIFGTGVDLSF